MIEVYRTDNTEYEKNGDMPLLPIKARVNVELNGTWVLELEHPIDDEGRWKYLEEEAVVKCPSFNGDQLFRIKSIEKNDDSALVKAYPIFFDSKNDCFLTDIRPTVKNGQDALNIMLAQNVKYSAQSDIARKATAYYEYVNLMEAINGDSANSFLNRWGGEILYDNFEIIVNDRVGGDYGVELRYGKNIPANGITETVDMSEVVTRIYPKSYNGYKLSGNGYVDSPILSNYPTVKAATMKFDNIKMRADAQEDDEENGVTICDTQEQLDKALTEACKKQYEAGLDKPKVTIEADMVLLQNTDQYKDYEILETVSLGDTIHCLHNKLGIETDARVIELEYDCLTKRVTSVVLGDFKQNYLDKIAGSVDKIESVITPDGGLMADKVEGFLNAIKTQIRYQKSVAKKQDVRAILFEDLDPESPLYGALCLGTLGLQISKRRTADGRDWDWTTAFNANGGRADTIVAGKLADKTGSNWWNLETGEMQISARATVDGKPLEDQLAQNKSYMWIAYADNEQGNGISLEPEGKKYIGFAENQTSEKVDLSDPGKFKWSQIDGAQGANGIATVVLHLYKRSDFEPLRPTATLTYRFETDTLSGNIDNGWTRDIQEGDGPLYIISATASGRTETVEIEGTRWSQPVILAKDGENGVPGEPGKDGADGIDGLNVATVYLYKRAASKPSVPYYSVTYQFSDGYVSGLSNGWESKIPSGTDPLYMILATASSTGSTDSISPSEWSTPEIFAQNGEDGKMLYGTCGTYGGTARKDCTIEGFKLQSGVCVSIKFTYGNTAANPMLNINNTGSVYIYAYGSKLAAGSPYNWGNNATVVFIYDGTYWNIADGGALEKVEDAAKTATDFMKFDSTGLQIGNNQTGTWAGYRTRITGNSMEILDNSGAVVASFQVAEIELGKNSINTIIRFCGSKGNLWYNAAEDFFQLESKRLRNRATEIASLYAINGNVRSGYNAYTDRLEMYSYNAQNTGSQFLMNDKKAELYVKDKFLISAPNGIDFNPDKSKVLYEGVGWLDNGTINFPIPASSFMTGIVLVFSLNENGFGQDWAYSSHFIPKYLLQDIGEKPYSFILSAETFNITGVKFCYISNTRIVGHYSNGKYGTNNGITYDNRRWALRRVYGV